MSKLKEEELLSYQGGGAISAALLNAAASALKTLYSWGQNIGSTIGRALRNINC